MKILLNCEESQEVCIAFRKLGHEAYSLDLKPPSGGHPEWHIQADAFTELYYSNLNYQNRFLYPPSRLYERVISFPPCTDLANSGARWFRKKRLSGEQEQSINFFFEVWRLSHCTENPVGIMNDGDYIKKWFPLTYQRLVSNGFPFDPTQIIHPWQFGHKACKATCLWLQGLPLLKPTAIIGPPKKYSQMTKAELSEWTAIHRQPPGPQRATFRSKTFAGIAIAMATQWGKENITQKIYHQINLFAPAI